MTVGSSGGVLVVIWRSEVEYPGFSNGSQFALLGADHRVRPHDRPQDWTRHSSVRLGLHRDWKDEIDLCSVSLAPFHCHSWR